MRTFSMMLSSLCLEHTFVKIRTGCPLLVDELEHKAPLPRLCGPWSQDFSPSLSSGKGSLVPGIQWDSYKDPEYAESCCLLGCCLALPTTSSVHILLSQAWSLFLLNRKPLSPGFHPCHWSGLDFPPSLFSTDEVSFLWRTRALSWPLPTPQTPPLESFLYALFLVS